MRKKNLIHPGEILQEEFLVPMGISQTRLALDIRVPAPRVNAIVRGKRSITAEMKYKMKLCRDFVKFFPLVTQKGDAFLTLCHAGKYDFKQNAELVLQWANEIYEQSQNRLQVYRRIKALAEDSGMAAAFEEWKHAADYSRKMAQ